MKNKIVEANICMVISKGFSGLNMNALKYLLPFWISPFTGVALRCVFAAVAFWIISFFVPSEHSTGKQKVQIFLLGALGVYGYMCLYLVGLSKTTPVSSSIFSTLQPVWVFLIAVLFYQEKVTWMKVVGILIGLGGALLCISTQQSDDLASDALTGNLLCLGSSVMYAVYLVISNRILKSVGMFTLLKYVFTGAAFSSLIMACFIKFDASDTLVTALCFIICSYFSDGNQLFADTGRIEISEYDHCCHIRLFNFDSSDYCFFIYRARSV